MNALRSVALLLLISCASATLHAEASLPADNDKAGWNQLIDIFAECSAVYNLAANLREFPAKGNTTYRELANNALIAGLYSAHNIQLGDSYLESIYTVKFSLWDSSLDDEERARSLLDKAEQCIADTLVLQNQLISRLRTSCAFAPASCPE